MHDFSPFQILFLRTFLPHKIDILKDPIHQSHCFDKFTTSFVSPITFILILWQSYSNKNHLTETAQWNVINFIVFIFHYNSQLDELYYLLFRSLSFPLSSLLISNNLLENWLRPSENIFYNCTLKFSFVWQKMLSVKTKNNWCMVEWIN